MPIGLYFTVNKSWVKEYTRHTKTGRLVVVRRYWRDDRPSLGHGTWESIGLPSWRRILEVWHPLNVPLWEEDYSYDSLVRFWQAHRALKWHVNNVGVAFQDVLGDDVTLDDEFMKHLLDRRRWDPKDNRWRYLAWLPFALKRPVEIWRQPVSHEQKRGRLYIGYFQDKRHGDHPRTFLVTARVRNGVLVAWNAQERKLREIDKRRQGDLLYNEYFRHTFEGGRNPRP
ncbi:PBECR2 nuclease fold domain-containing protein [Sulfobacillus harzensis]|uniref:Phage-Barnase-EndoU-ColicinE5/D-RelE like nuclease 2 domain-containing protein n=1 Tax=Sulfobacillus harzensis TaxID=2729629 RepID=A0A7Y0L021_9FIRM|nr:PBECR2 nuclease fold domain-containing protein [Sulfobacillus harzensis]NMP20783.1 hypothetical protein [Sulfobacillus harzensis]